MVRILLVDDDDDIRNIWQLALKPLGYEIFEAANGLEALYQARYNEPDLIILDLMMPTASGDLVLGFIRSTESLKRAIVVVVSAHHNVASLAEQYEADAYLAKPVNVAELRRMVTTLAPNTNGTSNGNGNGKGNGVNAPNGKAMPKPEELPK